MPKEAGLLTRAQAKGDSGYWIVSEDRMVVVGMEGEGWIRFQSSRYGGKIFITKRGLKALRAFKSGARSPQK